MPLYDDVSLVVFPSSINDRFSAEDPFIMIRIQGRTLLFNISQQVYKKQQQHRQGCYFGLSKYKKRKWVKGGVGGGKGGGGRRRKANQLEGKKTEEKNAGLTI